MKIILSTLLALATTSVQASNDIQTNAASGADLLAAWSMSDPVTTFSGNDVSMVFSTGSSETFTSDVHINEAFFGPDCSTNQILAGSGIAAANDPSKIPQGTWDDTNKQIKLDFTIVPEILNANTDYYTDDGSGVGTLTFCVRTSLGYGGTADQDLTLAQQIATGGFKEVNFREAIFTITYDLTAGFTQISAAVDPLARDAESESVNGRYNVEAWICDTTTDETVTINNVVRTYPAIKSGGFNQGALIPICIRPDPAAFAENVVMSHIKELKWVRDSTEQPAVVAAAGGVGPGTVSDNRLTFHGGCSGADFCLVESILFADFYTSTGTVNAEGSAQLMFGRRRLAAPKEERLLQQEAGSAFDLDVPVVTDNYGPAALKTAGGASLGLTALASAMALVSAFLLA